MPLCAITSFRLGLSDGVSVVAELWREMLEGLGFDVVTVAGEGPVDRTVAGLALGAEAPPPLSEVDDAFADVELVVVENLCTIPLNVPAARVVAHALRGRRAILHHHDPAWQRDDLDPTSGLPPDDPCWRHVVLTERTRTEMAERGIQATTLPNPFRVPPAPGDRAGERRRLGLTPDDVVVLHPVRAIARKRIPDAVALAESLGAVYWLPGPAEDGYGPELEDVLTSARVPVLRAPVRSLDDAYAACDLVAFPSTWEGFGNPPVEASLRWRPPAVGPYPVAEDLRALGFEWLDAADHDAVSRFLAEPDLAVLDHNRSVAEAHLSMEVVGRDLAALLDGAGWLP